MAKDSRKIPSFTIKSAGITLSCASLILLAVSLVLGIIAVMEALSDGGFENLNQNLSSQNYGTLTEWISLIAPQLVFALTVFWFIKKYNIDLHNGLKLNFKIPLITAVASIVLVFCCLYVGELLNMAISEIPGISNMEENLNTAFYFDEGWKFALAVVFVGIFPAIGEEVLFRGAVLFGLAKKNKFMAVFFSAFLFALMHANPVQFFYPFVMGSVMAYVDIVSNSIFPSVIMHSVNNIFVLFMSYFNVPITSGFLFSVIAGFASIAIIIAVLWLLTLYYLKRVKAKFPEKFYNISNSEQKSLSFGDEFTLYEEGSYIVKKEGVNRKEKNTVKKEKDIAHLSGKSRPSAILDILFYDYDIKEKADKGVLYLSEDEATIAVNSALAEISDTDNNDSEKNINYKPAYNDEILQHDALLKSNKKRYKEKLFKESEKKKENSFGGFVFATIILLVQFILGTISLL